MKRGINTEDVNQPLRAWVVVIDSQGVVYPMQDGVTIIEVKPVLDRIENATRFTNARRAVETARKTSCYSGTQAKATPVRDAR